MIWKKDGFSNPSSNRYHQNFEYMFIFSRGAPSNFNPIEDKPNIWGGTNIHGTRRLKNGKTEKITTTGTYKDFGMRYNVWEIPAEKDSAEIEHPAVFSEILVADHIKTWTNNGDTVCDPMMGSCTTGIAAKKLNRNFIGIEISPEYFAVAQRRINETMELFDTVKEDEGKLLL